MSDKLTLTELASLQNQTSAINTINNNFGLIAEKIDTLLSRDGDTPNQMESNLDMNSHRITNLVQPINVNEPVRLSDIQDLALGEMALITEDLIVDGAVQLKLGVAYINKTTDISLTDLSFMTVGMPIKSLCYTSENDGGGALWRKRASEPAHNAKKQSLDNSWFELDESDVFIEMLGASGTSATVDTQAIKDARDYVIAKTTATEGARGSLKCLVGRTYRINDLIQFNTPINVHFPAKFLETRAGGASPVTFEFGGTATTAGQNTQYKFFLQTLIAENQNTTVPSAISGTGGTGFRFKNMQFSEIVVESVRQFSFANYHFDCSGSSFSPQHVQQNTFRLGQIAYGGYGILVRSKNPSDSAFQANNISWQDMIANVTHIDIAEISGADLPADTSVNEWSGNLEKQSTHPSGVGLSLQGSYNRFSLGFVECAIILQASSVQNTIRALNTPTTGIVFVDNSSSNTNTICFGPPESGQIDQTITTPTDDVFVQNNYGYPIDVSVLVNIVGPSTAGSSQVDFIVKGPDGVSRTRDTYIETSSASPVAKYLTVGGMVRPFWSWKVKKTISGTGATVNYSSASAFGTGEI